MFASSRSSCRTGRMRFWVEEFEGGWCTWAVAHLGLTMRSIEMVSSQKYEGKKNSCPTAVCTMHTKHMHARPRKGG